MFSRVFSAAILGVDAYLVEVEIFVTNGLPSLDIVGLPGASVRESKERVRAAIKNSGFEFPLKRITVNLAPACIRKDESSLDLSVALGILSASGLIPGGRLGDCVVTGELSLDGRVRRVAGLLPMALAAKDAGRRFMVVPTENFGEVLLVPQIEPVPVGSLEEAVGFVSGALGQDDLPQAATRPLPGIVAGGRNLAAAPGGGDSYDVDMAEVRGQESAKRAMEIAAAGGHNLLMVGPPGSGKTMLALRLPTVLPPLSLGEALEVTKIYSVAGLLPPDTPLMTRRPFRNPHHTCSRAGLVGGGMVPRAGEVTLAHHGVLFLDEFPEFSTDVLESLRQPIEGGSITLVRAGHSVRFPAEFMLVLAANPCPCGYLGDGLKECRCNEFRMNRYRAKFSGPLLDRIDIQIEVPRLTDLELFEPGSGDDSRTVRERVTRAREMRWRRLGGGVRGVSGGGGAGGDGVGVGAGAARAGVGDGRGGGRSAEVGTGAARGEVGGERCGPDTTGADADGRWSSGVRAEAHGRGGARGNVAQYGPRGDVGAGVGTAAAIAGGLGRAAGERGISMDADAVKIVRTAMRKAGLSARAVSRVIRVARTIADLDGEGTVRARHVSEALQYRVGPW